MSVMTNASAAEAGLGRAARDSAADVRQILSGLAKQLEDADREAPKDFLAGLIQCIELTVGAQECVIHGSLKDAIGPVAFRCPAVLRRHTNG